MKPPHLLPALLAAILLFPSCKEGGNDAASSPDMVQEEEEAPDEPESKAPRAINDCDEDGMTELALVSKELTWRAEVDGQGQLDADLVELRGRIRALLRAGADPWARSLTREGKLADCAMKFWTQEFINELRAEGFDIPEAPSNPPAPTVAP